MFRKKLAAIHGLRQQLTLTSVLALAVVVSTAGCGNERSTGGSVKTAFPSGTSRDEIPTTPPGPSNEVIDDEFKFTSVVHGYKSVVRLSKAP